MKKICFCTTVSSSMTTFILPIIKKLHDNLDCEITIICSEDNALRQKLPSYIEYIPIKMKRGLDLGAPIIIIKLIKLFYKKKFDMVQYTTPNVSLYASIAAKLCRIKIRLYCQWGIRYVGLSGIKRHFFKTIEKITCSNSTDIRSPSKLNLKFAVEQKLCNKEKIKITGDGGTIGVDLTEYDITKKDKLRKQIRKKYNIPNNAFVYGFVGRVTEDKGFHELIMAYRAIENENSSRLIIIGNIDDNSKIKDELIQYVAKSKNIITTGRINNEDMHNYYPALDVLVHPTHREGFGLVIQEAGAYAVPTITTRIPGASEVMIDGESTILVQSKSVKELERAMRIASNDREKVKKIGKNAYKRTKKLYNRNKMLGDQIEDIKMLLFAEENKRENK